MESRNVMKGVPFTVLTACLYTVYSKNIKTYNSEKENSNLWKDEQKMPDSKHILGLGVAGVDYVATVATYPSPDSKIRTRSLNIIGGGNCGNSLSTIQRLGKGIVLKNEKSFLQSPLKTSIITKVGVDSNGEWILNDLQKEGVDVSHIVIKPNVSTGFVYVIVDPTTSTRTCIATPVEEEITKEEIINFIKQSKSSSILKNISLTHFDSRHTYAGYLLASYIQNMNNYHHNLSKSKIINQTNFSSSISSDSDPILMTVDVEKDRPPYVDKLLPLCHIVFTNQTFASSYIQAKLQNSNNNDNDENKFVLDEYKLNNIECRLISCDTDKCNTSQWHNWSDLQQTIECNHNDGSGSGPSLDLLKRLSTMECFFHLKSTPDAAMKKLYSDNNSNSDSNNNSMKTTATDTDTNSVVLDTKSAVSNVQVVVSTMGEQGSVLLKRKTSMTPSQYTSSHSHSQSDKSNSISIMSCNHNNSDNNCASMSLSQFEKLLTEKAPLQVEHLTLQVRNTKTTNKITQYEVIRCSAWPMQALGETVVDTTGAGDSYIGGFITATVLGCNSDTAMRLGTAVTSEKLKCIGSRQGLPTTEKLVDKLLQL